MTFDLLFARTRPIRNMPVFLRYLLATAIILLFFGLRSLVDSIMAGYPFLLFFPAVIFISLVFDRGTGVFAVLLSAVLAWYFFLPPAHSFELNSAKEALPLGLYVVVGLFLALVVEALRTTADRLRATTVELERAAEFNRLLLVDVNHRVKNHLAAVTALLRLSRREITDPAARNALEESAARIDVLGKVYTRLHLGERATVVPSQEFVVSLCDDLKASVVGARPIAIRAHAEEVDLSSAQAVPLGLIINELVENALKYAFPDDRAGDISVRFERAGACYRLSVADNGVGFDPALSKAGGGTRLIRSLAQQLGGTLVHTGPPGSVFTLDFPLEAPTA